MLRLLVYAFLLCAAYFFIKKVAKSFLEGYHQGGDRSPAPPPGEAELVQDPQCGSYFMRQKGIKGVVEGKVMHFCSEECYDKYLKRKSRS